MRRFLTAILCSAPLALLAFDFEVRFENDEIRVSKWRLAPHEEVGLHSDDRPAMIYAVQGGVITRIEEDGKTEDVAFPEGKGVWRPADPRMHRSVNPLDTPIEAIMIEFKQTP